ncbi:MAG: hypothetical protein LQ350_004613 [Teloschistes chrysophthalmus]|nr:MAG: hypothetical protein LQ350_004613 [Niorma chrysophthalma]
MFRITLLPLPITYLDLTVPLSFQSRTTTCHLLKMPQNKGTMSCYSSACARSFKDVPAILAHLESGGCSSGITIKDLHHLICQVPTAKSIIIPDRLPWFRAGPPRNEVRAIEDFEERTQQWRCTYCLESYPIRDHLARHLLTKTYLCIYPATLQCPMCPKGFVKLSELVGHCGSKACRAHAHPEDFYGPIVNHLERVLADWRPDVFQEPRIEYHLGFNRVSPRMMVHVVELPSTRAMSSSNVNGKSPEKKSPVKDNAMLEGKAEASSSADGLSGPINSNQANHPSSGHTSQSRLDENRHHEVTSPLMIAARSPEDSSQSANLTIATQQLPSGEVSEGKSKTHSLFPSSSSNTSFPTTNPSNPAEGSQQTGSEPLSVPMKINRRLEAKLSGTATEGPFSEISSSWGATGSRRSRLADLRSRLSALTALATSSDSLRENRFHRKPYPRNDGGSTHRDRRQHESKMAVALTNSQDQELSQEQSLEEEDQFEGFSTDDEEDENGGVAL